MLIQRDIQNAAFAEPLHHTDEAELAKKPEACTDTEPSRLLKVGKHRPFRPFRAIQMTGDGPAASEMVIQGRMP